MAIKKLSPDLKCMLFNSLIINTFKEIALFLKYKSLGSDTVVKSITF